MLDSKTYWDNKIISWEKSYFDNKSYESIPILEKIASKFRKPLIARKQNLLQIIQNEINLLENPPYSLEDDPSWLIDQEVKFLGCPVTLSKIDVSDTSAANTTCKEILNGKYGQNLCVVANIQRVADYKISKGESKGKIMSFLTIEDDTCILDSVIAFPKTKQKYKYILYEGNNLILCGSVAKNDSSFIVEKIHEV